MRSPLLLAVPLAVTLAACASPAAPASPGTAGAGEPIAIATTTQLGSILSDITSCAGSTSATLMGPGDDPHDFALASNQVAALTRAKLVVANGLGLESGLEPALRGAQGDGATLYEVAPDLDPLTWAETSKLQADGHAGHDHAHDDDASGGDDHAHGTLDPHVHLDAGRMARAAGLIGAQLAEVIGDDRYATCGEQVEQELDDVDAQVREILSAIPDHKRSMVTDHAAYHYFAQAYDFHVAGVVIPGGGTDAEPSSQDLAALVEVVKADDVAVMVSNNVLSPRLVETVAGEAGTDLALVQLYEGSVGPEGSGAETYADMMLTNARLLADALK